MGDYVIAFPVEYRERPVGKSVRRTVVDANGNELLEPYGETVGEIQALGKKLAELMNLHKDELEKVWS